MRQRCFTYEFEELPLVSDAGFDACGITGFAEINYDASGAWSVGRIGFEGAKRIKAVVHNRPAAAQAGRSFLERRMLFLDIGDPIQIIVYHRLEHDWRARVQDRVDDRIFDDRNDDADRRADHAVALRRERP